MIELKFWLQNVQWSWKVQIRSGMLPSFKIHVEHRQLITTTLSKPNGASIMRVIHWIRSASKSVLFSNDILTVDFLCGYFWKIPTIMHFKRTHWRSRDSFYTVANITKADFWSRPQGRHVTHRDEVGPQWWTLSPRREVIPGRGGVKTLCSHLHYS
jgi:hypothetical protein